MIDKLFELIIVARNYLLDGMTILFSRVDQHQADKSSVLIIRLDAIGDFILWLNASVELRRLYPPERYRLVLFGNDLWTQFAAQFPHFDEVIPVERKRLHYDIRYRFNIWKLLRSRSWAYAIHPTFSRDCNCGDAVVRMSNATERIGSKGDLSNQPAWQRWISNRWYTQLFPASEEPLMELERNAEFVRYLGGKDFKAGLPELVISAKLPPRFDARDYIVVVPGSSVALKQWPVEKFAELCERLHGMFGFEIIVCGSQSETNLGKCLLALVAGGKAEWIEDWTGKTSLVELAAVIKGSKMLIANDSSAVHMAAAVGTSSFCILGGGHFGRFVPYRLENTTARPLPVAIFHKLDCYGCNLKCKKDLSSGDAGTCITLITVDDVLKKMAEIV